MDINFQKGTPLEIVGDCLLVGLFEEEEFSSGELNRVNLALDGSLRPLFDEGELV